MGEYVRKMLSCYLLFVCYLLKEGPSLVDIFFFNGKVSVLSSGTNNAGMKICFPPISAISFQLLFAIPHPSGKLIFSLGLHCMH